MLIANSISTTIISPQGGTVAFNAHAPQIFSTPPRKQPHPNYVKDNKFWLDVVSALRKYGVDSQREPLRVYVEDNPDENKVLFKKFQKNMPVFMSIENSELVRSLQEVGRYGGNIITPSFRSTLESKCQTATSWKRLQDPYQGREIIQSYFADKGMVKTDAEINKILSFAKGTLPKTGVIEPIESHISAQDVAREIRTVFKNFEDKGVVFQVDKSSNGRGTAIFSSEVIKDCLSKTDDELITILSEKLEIRNINTRGLLNEMAKSGISYQEKIAFKEEGSMIYENDGHNNYTPSLSSNQIMTDNFNYSGTILHDPEHFEFYKENKELFDLIHLLSIDDMLKRNNKGKVADIKQEASGDENKLELFGVDLFVAEDGKIIPSEYNVRPTGSTRANDSRKHLNQYFPYEMESVVLRNSLMTLSRDQMNVLHNKGAEAVAKFIFDTVSSHLPKESNVVFDGSHFIQSKSDENKVQIGIMFPAISDSKVHYECVVADSMNLLAETPAERLEAIIPMNGRESGLTESRAKDWHAGTVENKMAAAQAKFELMRTKRQSFESPI